jgi:hypothetical protein
MAVSALLAQFRATQCLANREGANVKPSSLAACYTAEPPPRHRPQMSPMLRQRDVPNVSKALTDAQE